MSDSSQTENPPLLQRLWREWRGLIVFIAIMVVFRSAIADWNQVPTGSMIPTILEGDRVVVNKLAYDLKVPFTTTHITSWANPARGEIVTFYSPEDEKLLIKRVIGIPGDVVSMRNNRLLVNGGTATYDPVNPQELAGLGLMLTGKRAYIENLQQHTHIIMLQSDTPGMVTNFSPQHIPQGQYLMLGDNRDRSKDSRFIGLIERQRITGRAHTVAFSVDYEDYYLPRVERFLHPLQLDQGDG